MNNPFCTCSGSWSTSGSSFTRCQSCEDGTELIQVIVNNRTRQRVYDALGEIDKTGERKSTSPGASE